MSDDVKHDEIKHYLVDTSAIMDDPEVIVALGKGGNHVYIHRKVIQELDDNKDNPKINPFARGNARKALSYLSEVLIGYNKINPISLNNGEGWLQIVYPDEGKEYHYADPALLDFLKQAYTKEQKLILITEDIGLLVDALADGYQAEVRRDKRKGKSIHDILNLPEEVDLPSEHREELRAKRQTKIEQGKIELPPLYHNQYVYLTGEALPLKHRLAGGYNLFSRLIKDGFEILEGIHPKNKEQRYLIDLCLDENIRIASVLAQAGTGKTLISLAAGFHLTLNEKKYKRVVIIRPVMTIGKELGYLPGDLEEKMDPFMGAIRDASEVISEGVSKKKTGKSDVERTDLDYLINEGLVMFMTPTFVRGRNIPNSFMIVDEAQNLDEDTVKTLATRVGLGSKILFNGDPYQIDNPYLDQEKNGLTHLTKRLLGEDIFSTVILKKGERSPVSELAAKLL